VKLAVDNSDFTIQGWLRNRPFCTMTAEDRTILKAILALDHGYKEAIRRGNRKHG
jgi:hypothetical protein